MLNAPYQSTSSTFASIPCYFVASPLLLYLHFACENYEKIIMRRLVYPEFLPDRLALSGEEVTTFAFVLCPWGLLTNIPSFLR